MSHATATIDLLAMLAFVIGALTLFVLLLWLDAAVGQIDGEAFATTLVESVGVAIALAQISAEKFQKKRAAQTFGEVTPSGSHHEPKERLVA